MGDIDMQQLNEVIEFYHDLPSPACANVEAHLWKVVARQGSNRCTKYSDQNA